jgi:hypothetical protein
MTHIQENNPMALKLLREATLLSKLSDNKKRTLTMLESVIGKAAAHKLVESYQVTESDYDKWLDVIRGYAKTEGLNVKTKNIFAEIAGGVLENDPAVIDQDMQAAIIDVLWAKFKAHLTHSKVEKVSRAKEEEEQLNFALNKMKGGQPGDSFRARDRNFNTMNAMDQENEERTIAPGDPEYAAAVMREYRNSQRRNVLYTKPDEYGDYDADAEESAYNERARARKYANRFNPEEDEEFLPPTDQDWDDELDDEESDRMGSAFGKLRNHAIDDLEPPRIPSFKKSRALKGKYAEDEEESEFSQLFRQSQGMEDEEQDDYEDADFDEDSMEPPTLGDEDADFDEDSMEPPTPGDEDADFDEESMEPPSIPGRYNSDDDSDDEYSPNDYGDDDTRGRRWDQEDEEFQPRGRKLASNADFDIGGEHADNEYDDLDDEDYDAISSGEHTNKRGDFDDDLNPPGDEDYDSDEYDQDMDITSKGRRYEKERDLEDFDSNDKEYEHRPAGNGSYLMPKRSFKASLEDEELADKGSKFKKGQVVSCKRDGKHYKVEITPAAGGSGDYTGVIDNGRIRMILTKDLEGVQQSEDEESTSKQPSKVSFLHDLLTGSKTTANIKQLQSEIENEAANAWTIHHSKMPSNPHEKGSIAHKAWERGVKQAASAVWAPKPVVVNTKAKPKKKK